MPFIFSRRYIQDCLDGLRPFISDEQHRNLVSLLNRRKDSRLPAMWETVVLRALCTLPGFAHERPLENGRSPDFQFDLPSSCAHVVGDIGSVSDRGAKSANAIEQLIADIARIAKKYGSDSSQFDVYVPGKTIGDHDKRKVVLEVPRGKQIETFLKEELEPYIQKRLELQDFGNKEYLRAGDYEVQITFKPKSQFSSYGHPVFTEILHIDRNPVWNTLKSKAEQLKGAPNGAARLLILCDGGSSAMKMKGLGGELQVLDVVEEYLRRERGIDIVVTMSIHDEHQVLGGSILRHDWHWRVRNSWLNVDNVHKRIANEIQEIFNRFGRQFPKPTSNPESAYKNCRDMDYGIGGLGGYTMQGKKFTISSRTVLRVLAGELSIEEFNEAHGWDEGKYGGNRFARALKEGHSISRISLDTEIRQDDDTIEFEFSPDPAILPFK